MRDLKPLTDAELADMERWADYDLGVHAEDDYADRLRSMVFEIRLHRDAMAPSMLRAARLHTDELDALRRRVADLEAMKEALDRAAAQNTAGGDPTELARRVIDKIEGQPYSIVYALAKQVLRDHGHTLLLMARVAELETTLETKPE